MVSQGDRHVSAQQQLGIARVRDVGTAAAEEDQLDHPACLPFGGRIFNAP
jgi:hypothetical protein